MSLEKSQLNWYIEPETGVLVFMGKVNPHDVARLQLDPLDKAVVTSPISSGADLFQTLEILWRRAAEQGR